jgi:hypothetical protein
MLLQETVEAINKILQNSEQVIGFTDKIISSSTRENGHSYAQEWQELLLRIFSINFPEKVYVEVKNGSKHEMIKYIDAQGQKLLQRSFGDFYLYENNYYNPIDAKLNASETPGQPNTSSMMRQIKKWEKDEIDSFYVARLKANQKKIMFYDIYNHFYCLTYNMGTGQIMTAESSFNINNPKVLARGERVLKLKELYQKGVEEHIKLKKKQSLKNILILETLIEGSR